MAASLRELFLRASRLRRTTRADFDRLVKAFGNAGAWLRAYHCLPVANDLGVRDMRRDECVDSLKRFCSYFEDLGDHAAFFHALASRAPAAAGAALPETLPIGVRHGDYALHNVLVSPDCRITGFDTQANWRVPVYEDIAYFLFSLKGMPPQDYTQGLLFPRSVVRRFEHEFLLGYFGQDPIPLDAVRFFEIRALLDRWASFVDSERRDCGVRKVVKRARLALRGCFLLRYLRQLVSEVDGLVSARR